MTMTIGNRIKKLREENNMTQEELAKHINSTKQTIYKYENDIITNIPSDKIEKISEVLGTKPSCLMGWEIEKAIKEISNAFGIVCKKNKKDFFTDDILELIGNYNKLNDIGQREANKRVEELTCINKYSNHNDDELALCVAETPPEHLVLNAAHEIEGSSEEDKKHDDDIMNGEDF